MREMHVGRGTGWDNRGRGKRREGTRRTQLGTAWRGLNVAEAMVREMRCVKRYPTGTSHWSNETRTDDRAPHPWLAVACVGRGGEA